MNNPSKKYEKFSIHHNFIILQVLIECNNNESDNSMEPNEKEREQEVESDEER
jgi:hypothetical protein